MGRLERAAMQLIRTRTAPVVAVLLRFYPAGRTRAWAGAL